MAQRSGQQAVKASRKQARAEKLKFFGAESVETNERDPREDMPMGLDRSAATLRGHSAAISCVAFSPDGSLLVSGAHGTLHCLCILS